MANKSYSTKELNDYYASLYRMEQHDKDLFRQWLERNGHSEDEAKEISTNDQPAFDDWLAYKEMQ